MPPAVRKFALVVHLTSSVGWIGAVIAYLALGVAAVVSSDAQTVRAAWTAMDLTGWWVIVPLAMAALTSGLVMSLGTGWGLFRHYWVLVSLVLTGLCTVVLVLHMPTVSATARTARSADGAALRALGGDLFHPAIGLLVLLAITVLNVYKPAGLTPYGWRKQRELARQRAGRPQPVGAPRVMRAEAVQSVQDAPPIATQAGYFVADLAEMWLAMLPGMAAFMVLRMVLGGLGSAALRDPTAIEFQAGMGAFMVAPMVAWMRVRGCSWGECGGMSVAMLLSTPALVLLRAFELQDALLWLAANQHVLMLVGMLAFTLYRREHYTRRYASRRPAAWQGVNA